jgi:hypothetical protein
MEYNQSAYEEQGWVTYSRPGSKREPADLREKRGIDPEVEASGGPSAGLTKVILVLF